MNKASPIPPGAYRNSRVWRGDRLAPLSALLILITGFSTTWVSASPEHPARVSFMDGRAAYETSGDVDWNEVTLNLPLVSGDRVVAHPDSRIEVELGDGNFVRISGETDVFFSELSQKKNILKIHQGDLILRVNDAGGIHAETDVASVSFREKGLYRIQVDPGGSMRLVVHKGRVEVRSPHGKVRVETGHELRLDGQQSGIQALVRDLDDFELWSGRRDALLVSSRSTGYLGGVDYPGVHALDHHGDWVHYGSHGHVWVPTVAVGWAPFRHGRWGYLAGGWTWVSYEPWGWLPYHYGRWIYYGPRARWAWVPGGFNRWRAAHVDFYWGNGYVGWAPRGYYGRGYRGRGNTTVVVQNNVFRNWNPRDRSNGLTVVHGRNLGRGPGRTRVVASNAIVGSFRQGLPRELRRPRVRGPNSVNSRSGVRSSRLASKPADRTRDRVVKGGSRRSTVNRSDRTGPTRAITRQRSDSRQQGRSRESLSRSRTQASQPARSSTSSRDLSRSSSGSTRSVTKRTNRSPSGPSVSRPGGSSVRAPSRPSNVSRPDRTGSTRTFTRQRPDSRQSGRSGANVIRTPTRAPQSSRSPASSRGLSRPSSGSRGSVTKRTSRSPSRPSVTNPGNSQVRAPSRPSFVSRPNRTGSTGSFTRQRTDSRQSGRSGPNVIRTPTRVPQSTRSPASSRNISRPSSGSRGSVTKRTPRNQARPSVSSSRRSRPTSQRTVSRPAVRSSSRPSSRPSVQSRPSPRSTPSYRAPAPSRSKPSKSKVRSAPRRSGSSGSSSRSRRSSRSR